MTRRFRRWPWMISNGNSDRIPEQVIPLIQTKIASPSIETGECRTKWLRSGPSIPLRVRSFCCPFAATRSASLIQGQNTSLILAEVNSDQRGGNSSSGRQVGLVPTGRSDCFCPITAPHLLNPGPIRVTLTWPADYPSTIRTAIAWSVAAPQRRIISLHDSGLVRVI